MKIGFLIARMTYFKTLGNLIDAALAGGHEAWLFYLADAELGSKSYQKAVPDDFPHFHSGQPEAAPYRPEEVGNLGRRYGLDALVTHEGYRIMSAQGQAAQLLRLREGGTKTFALSHFFEFSKQPLEALDHFDKTFFLSEFARDLMFDLHAANGNAPALRAAHLHKTAIASSPAFEQIGQTDPAAARREFGIPEGQRVVLLAAPVLSGVTSWRWVVWREAARRTRLKRVASTGRWGYLAETLSGPAFKDCVDEIRSFCDRSNAVLVVKSRQKQDDPDYLVAAADVYLDGSVEEYYPVFTTYRILAAADMLISANSMSIIEAVAAGIPAVNIYVPHREFNRDPVPIRRRYLDALLAFKPGNLMHYPGCIWGVDRRAFPGWLRRKVLSDFRVDPERRKAYIEKYLDIREASSSLRILGEIEQVVAHG
ncbi:MAG: hypothetical protein HYZ26_09505 [Chloroflexi bacterium]|nr:hypothetical protein [Chloroflexota bacterium]